MKTNLTLRPRLRAFTYMTVIVTMVIVGIMLAAYLKLVAVQNQITIRSQTWNRSVPVLEAGIEEAMAHLNKNGSPDSGGNLTLANLASEGWTDIGGAGTGPWQKWGYMDRDFYFVSIGSWSGTTTNFPFINSTGFVRQLPAYTWNRAFGPQIAASILDTLVAGGQFSRRTVQCATTNNPTFSKGLVARRGINMNGNNVTTDSFDSDNALYSTNRRWDANKRRDNGDVASNDTITNTINVGNANIFGRVSTGPHGTVSIGPNGSVGNNAWHAGGNNGIQPGYSMDDMNVEFPDVVMPNVAWSAMPSGGSGYTYIFNTPGDYQLSSGTISGKILVTAPNVRLRVDGGWNFTGQDALVINSNASIKIYLNCPSAKITGQGVLHQGVANYGTSEQCAIFGTPVLTDLDIGGNGEATCVVYAPQANVKLHGGGNSDQDFSGALIANSFIFTGHYNIHYDEALGRRGLWRGFTIVSWNEK